MYSIIDTKDLVTGKDYEFKKWKNVNCPEHCHYIFEIVIVYSGTFKIEKENEQYILTQNQMMFIMPFEIHKFETIGNSEILVIQISQNILPDFDKYLKNKKPKNPVCSITNREIEFIENHIRNTNINKDIELNCIFFALLSIISKDNEFTDFSLPNDTFRKMLIYITSHYEENICLKDIAKELKVSYVYLSRLYSKNIHVRFNDFINSLRIRKSITLLANNNLSISEISFMCGFGSIRNFNRIFLNELGCTPKQFRNEKKTLPDVTGTEL